MIHGDARKCSDMLGYGWGWLGWLEYEQRCLGHVWGCLDMLGDAWICMDMHGYAWVCMDMHGYAWITFSTFMLGEKTLYPLNNTPNRSG